MSNETKFRQAQNVLTICVGFILLFFIFKIKILLLIALLAGGLSLLSDVMMEKISWVWMKIAHILGYINSKILLSVVFFVFLLPVATLYRLSKKNLLQLRRGQGSYYHTRDHQYTAKDLENTW